LLTERHRFIRSYEICISLIKEHGEVIGMDNLDTSGTEKWIEVVLRELHEASTVEIVNRVSIFNQDCADRIPMVLTQMRMEGKISYRVVQAKEGKRKNIVWRLEPSE
jgi:hypothetical protein